jgi:hypothetical protein
MTTNITGENKWPTNVIIPEDGDVHSPEAYHDMHKALADRATYLKERSDKRASWTGSGAGVAYQGGVGTAVLEETVATTSYSATVKCVVDKSTHPIAHGDYIWIVGFLLCTNLTPVGNLLSLVDLASGTLRQLPGYSAYFNDIGGANDEHVIPINHMWVADAQMAAMGLDIRVYNGASSGSIDLRRPWELTAVIMGPN